MGLQERTIVTLYSSVKNSKETDMCNALKYGIGLTSIAKIGDPIPITCRASGIYSTAEWSGHAQQEKAKWWRTQSTTVSIGITAFVEGRTEFRIPEGHMVWGLKLTRDVIVRGKMIGKAGTVKMVTREPCNSLERSIHNRWPVVLYDLTAKVYAFTEEDVMGPVQRQLL